ncbi:OLC1v1007455C1 [Oldenlandia corymbosa var. corymbosa]|uniref:OLC1v1007455C1 n=1 Tax=Oldenlandia corymbosa var. corymbosa TaxID=529605 RepID=A0AAV1DJC5_OLDCO|nr:OLC1v1007455C1 [Oldenlandia corymbosa var. corymbosa]
MTSNWNGSQALEDDHHRTFFAEEADEVAELLTTGPENLEVIYILGMFGLGKTTLAKIAYNHPNVDYEYMIRAFVNVSQDYDGKEILLKILASFSQINEEVTNMGIRGLKKYIRKQLEGKKYMIALDDVWGLEDWDRLKDVFPNNNKRCRVMITTRHVEVAKYANPSNPEYVYTLYYLTLDESRELLRSRVFHKNHCPQKLQEFELEIVETCGGLPLAIEVMASIILNHPESIDWWKDVAKFVKHYIARDMSQTFEVVESMYNLLPNYLKPCFLYLGAFHEDLEIPVWKLVRLWISEGFIQQDGNSNLEDIAEKGKAAMENLFQHIHEYNFRSFLSGDPRLDHHRRLCFHNVNVLVYFQNNFR